MSRLILPEGISAGAAGERDLVEALEAELNSSEIEANLHLVTWKIVDAYLAGVRRFKVLDRWSGNLSIAFENYKGELDLRYEDVVRRFLVECGRYLRGGPVPGGGSNWGDAGVPTAGGYRQCLPHVSHLQNTNGQVQSGPHSELHQVWYHGGVPL